MRSVDQGSLWPLIVSVPLSASQPAGASLSLQKLVIAWRNQAARHAIMARDALPQRLPLQINRFDEAGRKVHHEVQWSSAVYMPVYTGEGLQTTSQRYIVSSVVYHIGPSRLHGHFRAALANNVTDDNIPTQPLSVSDLRCVQQNSYLFFLRKAS